MDLTYFCPSCWSEVEAAAICPACGADLSDFADLSYEVKLIRALRHPEPTVPIRVAAILGQLGSRAAVNPLVALAMDGPDPYIQEAAVEALRQIGDGRALPCLSRLSQDGAVRVRTAARRAAKAIKENLLARNS